MRQFASAQAQQATASAGTSGQTPRSRPSQGELIEEVMARETTKYPLIDIAINLTDRSFDKVRPQNLYYTQT